MTAIKNYIFHFISIKKCNTAALELGIVQGHRYRYFGIENGIEDSEIQGSRYYMPCAHDNLFA